VAVAIGGVLLGGLISIAASRSRRPEPRTATA
jgi:hypothetical protein